jgi:hypothetical protein
MMRRLMVAGALALAGTNTVASAQEPLGGRVGWTITPMIESWSIGNGALLSPDSASGFVKSASQFSVPLIGAADITRSLRVDMYIAYAHGSVKLRDAVNGSDTRELSGLSDLRVRGVYRLMGDALVATLGVNVPTGKTKLDSTEIGALRVLGAPALRFQTPSLGTGFGVTTGLLGTRRAGDWSVGGGVSLEVRSKYQPVQLIGGAGADLTPGTAVRVSVGVDRLLGQNAFSLSLAGIYYAKDKLAQDTGNIGIQLGPSATIDAQYRLATSLFPQLTIYAFDRYRSQFKDAAGNKIDGTSGNELDYGAQGMRPLSTNLSLVTGILGRWHTGLKVDNAIATAAAATIGAQVGLAYGWNGWNLQPFGRAQVGSLKNGDASATATGLAAGLIIGSRF